MLETNGIILLLRSLNFSDVEAVGKELYRKTNWLGK